MMHPDNKEKAKALVEPLTTFLNNPDAEQRLAAVMLLGEINDKRALSPLIPLLSDPDPAVRRETVLVVGNLPGEEQLIHILKALDDPEESVWKMALEVLSYWHELEALEPLIHFFPKVDKSDNWAFNRLNEAFAYIYQHHKDKNVVETLIEALEHPNPDIRSGVARVLPHLGDDRIIDPLIKALEDKEAVVRINAAKSLIEMRAPDLKHLFEPLTETFINDLHDEEADVRATAAQVLDQIADPRAAESLRPLLHDASLDVRIAATNALGRISDRESVDDFIAILGDEAWQVRTAAIRALKNIGDPRAIDAVIAKLDDDEPWVINYAGQMLITFDDPRVLKALSAAVDHPAASTRRTAIWLLTSFGGDTAIKVIRGAINDPDKWVQRTARAALFKLTKGAEPLRIEGQPAYEQIEYTADLLRDEIYKLEKKLIQAGFDSVPAHDWLFHIREIIDQWKDDQVELSEICQTTHMREFPKLLDGFVGSLRYGGWDHINYHLRELEKLLMKVLPDVYEFEDDEQVKFYEDEDEENDVR